MLSYLKGGCTKYIQAQGISWNKPVEKNDAWLESMGVNNMTENNNFKPPHGRAVLSSVLEAWRKLPKETIAKSFKSLALNLSVDGKNAIWFTTS